MSGVGSPKWTPDLPAPPVPTVRVTADGEDGLREAVLAVYDIEADDRALRRLADLPASEQGPYFDRLRKEYPQRREFPCTTVTAPDALHEALRGLGFQVAASDEGA